MRSLILMLLPLALTAAVGDHAPSIPSTYVAGHPRLPHPDNTYLDTIWAARSTGAAYIWTDAAAWDSSAPGSRTEMWNLLAAYLAEKRNSGPNTAAYLAKIQGFQNLAGNWDLSTGSGYWDPMLALALAYDWTYADLGGSAQASMRSSLYTILSGWEAHYVSGQYSPYNDQFYITDFQRCLHLIGALAIYPDDSANSLPHLRWSMDMLFNILLPAWKQVIGGGCDHAAADSENTCGGAWHEGWVDYANSPTNTGLMQQYIPTLLSWWKATGDNIFTREPWIKNFAYWTMYNVRPDFTWEPIGQVSRPYMTSEYDAASGVGLGSLEGLAAIYNDPTLRGWARLVNNNVSPDGFHTTAWPFYTPDVAGNSTNTRASLSKVRDFPGVGTIYFRTGWGEDDTFCTLRYGNSYWSHTVQDAGAFTCFNRGPLAIRSSTYRAGSASAHEEKYGRQAISQNVPLVYDSADRYSSETFTIYHNDGTTSEDVVPNDGGQRRVGTDYNQHFTAQQAPADKAMLNRGREYYHQGEVGYAVGSGNKYAYAAVDITDAYNNLYSRNAYSTAYSNTTANTTNRSFRVQKAVRHFVFIPRGTAAYVVVFDQLISTNSAFTKKVLFHFINSPTVSGTTWNSTRADLVTSKPFPQFWPQQWSSQLTHCPTACSNSSTQYQYAGKIYGWMAQPSGGSITTVGGTGHQFDVTDSAGTTNWSEAMQGQIVANTEGLGAVTDVVTPDASSAPHQPGAYRIEETVGASNLSDQFINVMLVTTNTDANVPAGGNIPSATLTGGNWVITWSDQTTTCAYTVTLPQYGVGGTITAIGAGCATVIN